MVDEMDEFVRRRVIRDQDERMCSMIMMHEEKGRAIGVRVTGEHSTVGTNQRRRNPTNR